MSSTTDSLSSQIYSEADTFLALAFAALPPVQGARLERQRGREPGPSRQAAARGAEDTDCCVMLVA